MKSFVVAALTLLALPLAQASDSAKISELVDGLSKTAHSIVTTQKKPTIQIPARAAAEFFIGSAFTRRPPTDREREILIDTFASLEKAGARFSVAGDDAQTGETVLLISDRETHAVYEVRFEDDEDTKN
jgi:hypothetical protein